MIRECRGEPLDCLLRYGIDAVVTDDRTAILLGEGGHRELRAPPEAR